jgi:hypothetical protein
MSALGANRTRQDGATHAIDPTETLVAKFAAMHHSAFPATMWYGFAYSR